MIARLFNHRYRGFRTINIVGFVLVMSLAVTVNLAKTYAGREAREIQRAERNIAEQKRRIRLLEAEVAHLEQPERLQTLSKAYLGMTPLSPMREGDMDSLTILVAGGTPPPPVATPAVAGAEAVEVTGAMSGDAESESSPAPAADTAPPGEAAEAIALAESGH